MRLAEEIAKARQALERLFLTQVVHGRQSAVLPDGVYACGQFVGTSAKNEAQRGLFGTAAAISVLATSEEPRAGEAVRNLVRYVEERAAIESDLAAKGGAPSGKLALDASNILRQSEVLFALTQVPSVVAHTDHLSSAIATSLLQSRKPDRSWGYFASDERGEAVPTAYAYLALRLAGYGQELRDTEDYLRVVLHDKATDSVSRLLVLYAIVRSESVDHFDVAHLRRAFRQVARVLASQLREPLEQNLEYWDGSRNHYIRIPWQLYYQCVEAALRPAFRFPTRRLFMLLRNAITDAQAGGFKYPHSGRLLSARTNAILHDTLRACVNGKQQTFYSTALVIDRIRDGASYLRLPVKLAAVFFVALSFAGYFIAPDWAVSKLATGLFASLLIALAFLATRDR